MQKTKLGISVGLFGALLYIMGMISFLTLMIAVGYVLLFETNEWLRKSALKALVIVSVFYLLQIFVGIGSDIFATLNGFVGWFDTGFRFDYPLNLDTIILNGLDTIKYIILVVLAIKGYKQGSIKLKKIDKIVEKNIVSN